MEFPKNSTKIVTTQIEFSKNSAKIITTQMQLNEKNRGSPSYGKFDALHYEYKCFMYTLENTNG